jgi:hypothetical protein
MSGFMDFLNVFFGSTQSQVTAYAILAVIVVMCITILLTRTSMNIGDRFLLIIFVILTLLPAIFLILFEITCMVTGGNSKERWWCWLYAWIIAVFIVIYCILIIIMSFSSLFTYNNAIDKVDLSEQQNRLSPDNSNEYARSMIETKQVMERFENKQEGVKALFNPASALNTLIGGDKENEENFDLSKEIITTPTTTKAPEHFVNKEQPQQEKKQEKKQEQVHVKSQEGDGEPIEGFIGGGLNYSAY